MALPVQSAAELAEQCIDRFDQTLEIAALTDNQWAENRRADFKLWADGVGAQASRNASLDARLEGREHELSLINTLLLNLRSYLGDCLSAEEGESLAEAKMDVDTAIDNLALIAVAIRRAGKKSRLLRADRRFDPTTLAELEMHLICMALLRRTSHNGDYPQHHKNDPAWWQSEIEGVLTPLQERLIEANLRRRNRFIYAQSHSKKLAIQQTQKRPIASLSVPDREEVSSLSQMEVNRRQAPQTDAWDATSPRMPAPTLSSTRASDMGSTLKLEEPRVPFHVPRTQITSITGATEYPKLREPSMKDSGERDIEGRKIQQCPCCCEALPRAAVASANGWK